MDLRGVKNLRRDFPSIYAKLKSLKINPFKDLIPATAVAHYSCGGVVTDLKGRVKLVGAGNIKGSGGGGNLSRTPNGEIQRSAGAYLEGFLRRGRLLVRGFMEPIVWLPILCWRRL